MNKGSVRIVIVDDMLNLLEIWQEVLRNSGYTNTVIFSDPLKARDHLGQHPVDVVISDFQMPGLDGWELLRRADNVPHKIMISAGFGDIPELKDRCKSSGILMMAKPVKPEGLVQILEEKLRIKPK